MQNFNKQCFLEKQWSYKSRTTVIMLFTRICSLVEKITSPMAEAPMYYHYYYLLLFCQYKTLISLFVVATFMEFKRIHRKKSTHFIFILKSQLEIKAQTIFQLIVPSRFYNFTNKCSYQHAFTYLFFLIVGGVNQD